MSKAYLIFCLLFTSFLLKGQNISGETGDFLDINDQVMSGYFDNDYNPKKYLAYNFNIYADPASGKYYNVNGEENRGKIMACMNINRIYQQILVGLNY